MRRMHMVDETGVQRANKIMDGSNNDHIGEYCFLYVSDDYEWPILVVIFTHKITSDPLDWVLAEKMI